MASLLLGSLGKLVRGTSPLVSRLSLNPVRMCSGKVDRPGVMGNRDKQSYGEGKTPISWVNLSVTGVVIAAMLGAYYYARDQKEAARDANRKREIGKAKIGGSFDLIDHTGKPKTSADFYGKWLLLYFGFTHCPDICPDEMEKMAKVYDDLKEERKTSKHIDDILPLFITVDPERDGVSQVAEYIKEFHPEMVGLTGKEDKIKEACKAFRVYFSAGPRDDDEDYIVDHTIIIYLIDPEGQFVDYYGQSKTAEQIKNSVSLQMMKWNNQNKKSIFSL